MNITLNEGKLHFKEYNKTDLKKLYNKFRKDLLDCNITHYRPVAFKLEGALANAVSSNISKIPGFGYSFSELSFILNNIITHEKKGIMPEKLNSVASLTKLRSDCSFLTLMGDTISTEVKESMFYCGEGIQSNPDMLLEDLTIFRKLKTSIAITVILMKSKGKLDFSDNQRLVYNTGFKSMRTIYNLYDFFSIKEYLGEEYIQLNYKEEINEKVLYNILVDYFNQEDVLECLK